MASALVAADSASRRQQFAQAVRSLAGMTDVEPTGSSDALLRRLDLRGYDLLVVEVEFAERTGLDAILLGASAHAATAVVLVGDSTRPIRPSTMRSMQLGTTWFVELPLGCEPEHTGELAADLADVMKRLSTRRRATAGVLESPAPRSPIPPQPGPAGTRRFWVAAIGISTGGPDALNDFMPRVPAHFPLPLLVVQHMPAVFTRSLAERLDARSALRVVEAVEGDAVVAGTAYIAPGGRHMTVVHDGLRPRIALNDDPPVHSCRPAVDVLFHSLAKAPERRGVLALVMTGMGYDGTAGVRALKQAGATWCITQSEASCVVYGMPRAVDAAGLSDESAPLSSIAERMVLRATSP